MSTTKSRPTDLAETIQPSLLKHLRYWYDDYLCAAALLRATGFTVDYFFWIKHGLGVHYQSRDEEHTTLVFYFFRDVLVEEMTYAATVSLSKLSILALYYRVFRVDSIKWPFESSLQPFYAGLLPGAYWDKTIDGECGVNDREYFFGSSFVHCFLDVVILALPMPYIKRLHISLAQKLSIGAIFVVGGFICISSIMLMVECLNLDVTSPDITWQFAPIGLWGVCEVNLALVTACLPSLRPIFLLLKPRHKTECSQNSKTLSDGSPSTRRRRGPKKSFLSALYSMRTVDTEMDVIHVNVDVDLSSRTGSMEDGKKCVSGDQ